MAGVNGMLDYITAVNDSTGNNVYKVTVVAEGPEGCGKVSASTSTAQTGQIVTVTASANAGFVFNNWGVTSGRDYSFTKTPTELQCGIKMGTSNLTIRGYFYKGNEGSAGGGSGGYVPTEQTVLSRAIPVPSIVSYYSDEELNTDYHTKEEYEQAINNYGNIFKTVSFSETSDVEKLKQYGREWIRRNYYDGVISFTIKAIDLRLLGYDTDKLLLGDRIPVNFIDDDKTVHRKILTILNVKYDVMKPENNTYKIGIPGVSDNPKYREAVGLSTTTSTKGKGRGAMINERFSDLKKRIDKVHKAMIGKLGIDVENEDKSTNYVIDLEIEEQNGAET